MWGESYMEDPA